ncbi:hypothetical protein ABIF50_010594 [Bradyrhizobium diazoefficiens]|jgi:hypothetical protein
MFLSFEHEECGAPAQPASGEPCDREAIVPLAALMEETRSTA